MALTTEDLELLSSFVDRKLAELGASAPQTPAERAAIVGTPDANPEAGPDYWIHLADGSVVVGKDSVSTHMLSNGEQTLVIGRYAK